MSKCGATVVKEVKRLLFLRFAVALFIKKLRDETRASRKLIDAEIKRIGRAKTQGR